VLVQELSEMEEDDVKDGKSGETAHAEPDPGGSSSDGKTSKEAGDDHDDVEDDDQTGEGRTGTGKSGELPEKEGSSDSPIYISGVVKLSSIFLSDETLLEGHGHVSRRCHGTNDDISRRELSDLFCPGFDDRQKEEEGRDDHETESHP